MTVFTIALFGYHVEMFATLFGYEMLGELLYILLDFPAMFLLFLCSLFFCIGCIKHSSVCLLLGVIFQFFYGSLYSGVAVLVYLVSEYHIVLQAVVGGYISFFVSILLFALYFYLPPEKQIW